MSFSIINFCIDFFEKYIILFLFCHLISFYFIFLFSDHNTGFYPQIMEWSNRILHHREFFIGATSDAPQYLL